MRTSHFTDFGTNEIQVAVLLITLRKSFCFPSPAAVTDFESYKTATVWRVAEKALSGNLMLQVKATFENQP